MKKILVPTDFSANALKAATYAAELAKRSGAILFLLHVVDSVVDGGAGLFPFSKKLEEKIMKAKKAELNGLVEIIANTYPDVVIRTELGMGNVADAISATARELGADMIIMGTRGASGLKQLFLGSVTGAIIGRLHIPVLAVPFEYTLDNPGTIVLASSHFDENRQQLGIIAELATLFGASVHAVVYVDTDTHNPGAYITSRRQLEHYLGFIRQTYPGISFTGELLVGSSFEKVMEAYEEKTGAGLVAMVTYPKNFTDRLLRKGATRKMAFHSHIPLLAIPAAPAAVN